MILTKNFPLQNKYIYILLYLENKRFNAMKKKIMREEEEEKRKTSNCWEECCCCGLSLARDKLKNKKSSAAIAGNSSFFCCLLLLPFFSIFGPFVEAVSMNNNDVLITYELQNINTN